MPSKKLLKDRVVAATGDFGEARTHDNLKRWVEANGGKWVTTITADITHLIASKEHWVRQTALGMGNCVDSSFAQTNSPGPQSRKRRRGGTSRS